LNKKSKQKRLLYTDYMHKTTADVTKLSHVLSTNTAYNQNCIFQKN